MQLCTSKELTMSYASMPRTLHLLTQKVEKSDQAYFALVVIYLSFIMSVTSTVLNSVTS